MGCTLRALLIGAVILFVLWAAGYVIAFHGNDIAAWAMAARFAGVAFWFRKQSATLRNLPPYNNMPQAREMNALQGQQPSEPFNLWNWLLNDSSEFFDKSRDVASNMDMWVTLIILFVAGFFILMIVNLFRGEFSLDTFRNPLQAGFKDASTSLQSLGFISFFILIGLVLSEGLAGRGWAYVSMAFTQFWWIAVVGIVAWAIIKAVGPDIGRWVVIVLGGAIVIVFLIAMANPGVSVGDVTVKVPLQGVSGFASTMYAGWMDTTKVYFWFLVMGIGSYTLAPMVRSKSSSGRP